MSTTTIKTAAGPMVIDEDELQVGRFLDAEGNIPTHEPELAFMRRHVREGDSVVDVGANAGFFTLALAQMVGEDGHVTAFEPNYDVIRNLGKTISDRGIRNIDAVTMAIGKDRGWGSLRKDPRGPGGTQFLLDIGGQGTTVIIRTLDTAPYIRHPVSFIKIDTEGMDVDVLVGAQDILEKDRPVVLFEWNTEAMQSLQKSAFHEMTVLCLGATTLHYILCDYRTDTPLVVPFDHLEDGDYALIPEERLDGR